MKFFVDCRGKEPVPLSRAAIFMCIVCILGANRLESQHKMAQDDTVLAPEDAPVPRIDGKGDDPCWLNAKWQSIGQVWIPYGAQPDTHDFSGRYKVVWSPQTNLLYFLIEVRDSIFVDGYVPGGTADIYNFDIAEIFIDEDASGGPHVFDGSGDFGREWGTNAANAFAYHIFAPFPKGDGVTAQHFVGDLRGTNWNDAKPVNYASHFPEFALRRSGHTAVWEFSLIVYNDTYQDSSKERARVKLASGKVMGLSVAYCDNDHPEKNPKVRDVMYGSVYEPPPGNLHWKNADYFGKVKLTGSSNSPQR
jgi:hypothetical protein